MKLNAYRTFDINRVRQSLARRRRAVCIGLFIGLALAALLTFVPSQSAFDVKSKEQSLAAKVLSLPKLSANFNQSQIDSFLMQPVWRAWNQSQGGKWTAQFDTLTGKPRRVYGGAIPWLPGAANSLKGTASAADLERIARDFINSNQSLIAAPNSRLKFVPAIANPTTDGHMRYAAFDYEINGVPVETARLVFAINNGNMIYWSSTNIANVPTLTTPVLSGAQALGALLAYAGVTSVETKMVQPATLRLIPRNTNVGGLLTYQLAYETAFRIKGGVATWAGLVDALTGNVIAFGDVNRYQDARTTATGRVTGGIRPARADDAEVVRSFPFVKIEGAEGQTQTTSINGLFSYGGGKVSTGLDGTRFDANCVDCLKSEADPVAGWQASVSASGNGRLALGTGGRDVVQTDRNGARVDKPTLSYGNGISTPAERTAFYHTNVARLMAKKWLDLAWLNESVIPVKVNINDVCNAFWDGSSLNFFKAGVVLGSAASSDYVCSNTGEIRDVMQHEWGHGLDSNDGRAPGYAVALGLGDLATGEGNGDHIALFVDHDSCIGQSFYNRYSGPFVTDPDADTYARCDGVRNIDELRSTRGTLDTTNVAVECSPDTGVPPVYFGPMLREGHCEGEIYGQFGWHLTQDLLTGKQYGTATVDANKEHQTSAGQPLPASADGSPNPLYDRDLAWTIHERLYFQSHPLVGSYAPSRFQAIGPSVYDGYIVTDDEGDGLSNGTPHAAYINDAAVHHGMEEFGLPGGRPSAIDAVNCANLEAPSVTLAQSIDAATGAPAVQISWTSVGGATSYSVLRSERRNDVFLQLAKVKNSDTSFTDVGVDNGVTYFYRVQANGGEVISSDDGGVGTSGDTTCWTASPGGVVNISVKQPDPRVKSVQLNDTPGGNGDGGLDAGEHALLLVVLGNSGLTNLSNVSATLSSITPGVAVTNGATRSYGSLAANASAAPNQSFEIAIDPNGALCGQTADFILSIRSDEGLFVDSFSLPVGNDGTSCVVHDSTWAQPTSVAITSDRLGATCGDGDLIPDPGETISVSVKVNNGGTRNADNVIVSLSTDKPYLRVTSPASVNVGTLAGQAAETKTATFTLSVARTAPFDDVATLIANVTATAQPAINTLTQSTRVNRDRKVRDFSYNFDTGAQGWTSSDTAAGWTTTALAPTTGNLTGMWYSQYKGDNCFYLASPSYEFTSASTFAFDIAYITENTDLPNDGVDVQVSVDGGKTWQTVAVKSATDATAGYPALSSGTSCIAKDVPVFSGYQPTMSRFTIDLAPYAGRTGQLRFRWGMDALVEVPTGGVWIDNVTAGGMIVAAPSTPCL